MRLKTLFFPIVLVISISIFAGYIWPEIMRLKASNEVKIAANKKLEDINVKKAAAELIGKQISSNDSEKTIKEYLPENKTEERIIGDVNYLASAANVSLVDISLSGERSSASKSNNESHLGLAGALNPVARAGASVGDVVATDVLPSSLDLAGTTSAKISISGEYEKIRVFLDGLHRLPIFSTVKSLNITKQQVEKKEGEAVPAGNILLANIDVNFGYMNVSKVNGQKVLTFKPDIDNEVVDVLKKYISQKAPSLEVGSDVKGKNNPFLAN